jgi:hypothetical protein
MFHLAAMDVVDEWDRDARTKVSRAGDEAIHAR